jgi:transposase
VQILPDTAFYKLGWDWDWEDVATWIAAKGDSFWNWVTSADWSHPLDVGSDFFSGFGDVLTFGLTAKYREWLGFDAYVEPSTKRVLWVGRGRGREDVRPFFEQLGMEGRQRLKAVSMDMNGAYEEEVRYQCPLVEIVFDLFHVVAKYGREVVDRVRVDEANRLREDKPARKVIKGARWLLLRDRENVKPKDRVKLDELLQANRKLATDYVLKDDLKHLWDYVYEGAARRFWEQWYSRAIRSRIEPLKDFARRLKKHLPGILAHCHWPLHASLLEGIDNKVKVIKRMAYGFRDDDYFFLKIRAGFPGNTGWTQ